MIGIEDKLGNINPSSNGQSGNVYSSESVGRTLCANGGGYGAKTGLYEHEYRVRKLTPKETFRLQAFSDKDHDACEKMGITATQLYKQMGNTICVQCIRLVGEHLYKALYDKDYICTDEVGIDAVEQWW